MIGTDLLEAAVVALRHIRLCRRNSHLCHLPSAVRIRPCQVARHLRVERRNPPLVCKARAIDVGSFRPLGGVTVNENTKGNDVVGKAVVIETVVEAKVVLVRVAGVQRSANSSASCLRHTDFKLTCTESMLPSSCPPSICFTAFSASSGCANSKAALPLFKPAERPPSASHPHSKPGGEITTTHRL